MKKSSYIDLYEIDIDYIKQLYSIDSQVFYNENDINYKDKPYVGIVVLYNKYNYFIPLTSAKNKHLKLKNSGQHHMLIRENLLKKHINEEKDIFKVIETSDNHENDIVKKIYSVIDFEKAVPVPQHCFSRITINNHKNEDLLRKELNFCISKKNQIMNKAVSTISNQHKTGVVNPGQCHYHKLEKECEKWSKQHLIICLKPEFIDNEFLTINTITDIKNSVNIRGGSFSRIEGFNPNNDDIQEIKIFAKDEFNQERYITLKIKLSTKVALPL